MEKIKRSVGKAAWNSPNDVAIVQALLNRHRPSKHPLLAVDKAAGKRTIEAIQEFQARVVKLPHPDGRVDPVGLTAEFLYTSPSWVSVQGTVKYLHTLVATVESGLKRAAAGFASVLPSNMFSQHNKIAWGAKVSPEFKAKVITICKNLNIQPDHLMTCMAFETKETFRPDKKNEAGSSGTGLIQFMKATAESVLKTTTEELANMTALQQLDYVEKYFKYIQQFHKRLDRLEDVYFAILNSDGIGKNDAAVIFKAGSLAYTQNKGLDKNKDSRITVGEITVRIRAMYQKGLQQGNLG